MCGIAGVISTKSEYNDVAKRIFKSLMTDNETRGNQSTGVLAINKNDNTFSLFKDTTPSSVFMQGKRFAQTSADIWIGHCRQATHGAINQRNAHPLQRGSDFVVHNGVITNHDEIGKELNFKHEVDSEILLPIIHDENWALLQRLRGSLNFIGWNSEKQKIYVERHENPLFILTLHELGITMFSSRDWAMEFIKDHYSNSDEDKIGEFKENALFVLSYRGTILESHEHLCFPTSYYQYSSASSTQQKEEENEEEEDETTQTPPKITGSSEHFHAPEPGNPGYWEFGDVDDPLNDDEWERPGQLSADLYRKATHEEKFDKDMEAHNEKVMQNAVAKAKKKKAEKITEGVNDFMYDKTDKKLMRRNRLTLFTQKVKNSEGVADSGLDNILDVIYKDSICDVCGADITDDEMNESYVVIEKPLCSDCLNLIEDSLVTIGRGEEVNFGAMKNGAIIRSLIENSYGITMPGDINYNTF